MSAHPTTTDGLWRVMRFETADGKYAEVASNHVGPEAIDLPDGYRFVRSTAMVARDEFWAEVRALLRLAYGALDTAGGVCQLVGDGRRPTDLDECAGEIENAKQIIAQALGEDAP